MDIATKLAEERRARLAAERLLELKEAELRWQILRPYNSLYPFIRTYINSHEIAFRCAKGITLLYEKTGPSEPVFWSFSKLALHRIPKGFHRREKV